MSPKKKGAKSSKGKSLTVVDGLPTEKQSKEQLEEHIVRLREELDREREERNYFQLERDKIHTFWEITKRQLEEKNADLRNRDREIEEAEERHQVEIKVYKQKVKHLLYEHQNNITELKMEEVGATKLLQKEPANQENELWKGKGDLKVNLKQQELSSENFIKSLKLKHDKEVSKIRTDFERQVREIESKYEKKMNALRQEQDQRRKNEIHDVEERKNSHINALIKNNEKAFSDIKNYYNDIMLNNLSLIDTLKEQMNKMKINEDKLEKETAAVLKQNKRLTEPLQKAREEVLELQKQLANHKKDKICLARTKAHLKVAEKTIKDLKWEREVLEQRFIKVQQERDDLYQKFSTSILEVQQKSGFKNLLLEKKLDVLTDTLEKKDAQPSEVLSASNLDQTGLRVITHKLEDVLDSKNTTIKDLQYELARTCKAHNDLLRTFEAKLKALNVPTNDINFEPLESRLLKDTLGEGPAGLASPSQ